MSSVFSSYKSTQSLYSRKCIRLKDMPSSISIFMWRLLNKFLGLDYVCKSEDSIWLLGAVIVVMMKNLLNMSSSIALLQGISGSFLVVFMVLFVCSLFYMLNSTSIRSIKMIHFTYLLLLFVGRFESCATTLFFKGSLPSLQGITISAIHCLFFPSLL